MTELREAVRVMLTKNHLTYAWLVQRLARQGIETGSASLTYALSGARSGPKYEQLLEACHDVLTDYERRMSV